MNKEKFDLQTILIHHIQIWSASCSTHLTRCYLIILNCKYIKISNSLLLNKNNLLKLIQFYEVITIFIFKNGKY